MTAAALTLTDFLLARIAEDETVALDLIAEGPWNEVHRGDHSGPTRDDEYSGLNIGAGRVLAECEAKRRIVEAGGRWLTDRSDGGWAFDLTVRHLAAVYADHPDYREEWRD